MGNPEEASDSRCQQGPSPAAIWGGNQRMEDLALTLPSSETKQRKEKKRQLYLSQESVPQVILFSHVYTTVR